MNMAQSLGVQQADLGIPHPLDDGIHQSIHLDRSIGQSCRIAPGWIGLKQSCGGTTRPRTTTCRRCCRIPPPAWNCPILVPGVPVGKREPLTHCRESGSQPPEHIPARRPAREPADRRDRPGSPNQRRPILLIGTPSNRLRIEQRGRCANVSCLVMDFNQNRVDQMDAPGAHQASDIHITPGCAVAGIPR